MFAPSLLPILLATLTFAATLHRKHDCQCPIPLNTLDLPASLPPLPSSPPSHVALGVGVQNYVCSSGNYTSVGADAELFDISCIWGRPDFEGIPDEAFNIWTECPISDPFEEGLRDDIRQAFHIGVIGQHHFIRVNGALFPEFNFTKGEEDGRFIVANKTASAHAPNDSQDDVDWLQLMKANVPNAGQLANEVYRLLTKGGQPPPSCQNGSSTLSVKYAAVYLFF